MVRSKHPDWKQLAIHLASTDVLSTDHVSGTGPGSRGLYRYIRCGLCLKKLVVDTDCLSRRNPSHLLGVPSAEALAIHHPRDYINAESCLDQGHSLPGQPHPMTEGCLGVKA